MLKRCPRCSSATELKPLGTVSAEDKPMKLTVSGMPVARCTKGHAAPVDNDFMLWLIHEVKARGAALPAGSEKGLLFKKYSCACGAELPAKPERLESFPFELSYTAAPAFKAEIGMPLYRCAACGKEQLRSAKELQGHTAQVIMSLNDAVGFPHSG